MKSINVLNNHELERSETELENLKDLVNLSDSLSVYLKDIGKIQLLTREEEIELANRVSAARKSNNEKIIELGKEARDKLVVSNLRLVVNIAKKYRYTNVPMMDLIQEGNMGLMKAIDRFQVKKGFRLSTYATWWIRQFISRSISNTARTIRIPVHIYDSLSVIKKVTNKYKKEHGKEPDIETVSKLTNISKPSLKIIYLCSDDAISLDQTVGEDDSKLLDFTEDKKNKNPEEYNNEKELDEFVDDILQVLDKREQAIIKMRFGIESNEMTLGEVGDLFGISRERVRQIQSRAMKKLKKQLIASRNNASL